jgi:hypothetical protein
VRTGLRMRFGTVSCALPRERVHAGYEFVER